MARPIALTLVLAGALSTATLSWAQAAGPPAAAPAPPPPAAGPAGPSPQEPPPPPEPPAPAPATRTWTIDAKKSQLVLQVFKDGAAAAFAHDHTVHATELAGEIVADPLTPESARVSVTVQTKSLVNDDPQVRKQFGLDPTVPEKDRKSVEESMKGPDQLDVARFPTISFVSSGVEKHGDKITLVGDFTLHGVTKRIKMPITVKVDGDTLVGGGKVRLKQSDWGIKPYSAFLGAVKNKDEIVLNVHLVGQLAGHASGS
jgi:polyisoprenoid-binding protein YceI